MGAEQAANKRVAEEFFERFSRGDVAHAAELMDENAEWLVMGKLEGMSGRYARDPFVELAESAKTHYKSGALQIKPKTMTAEEDRVSIIAEGFAELMDGRTYEPDYHFLLTFKNGAIQQILEFMDTQHAKEIFFDG